MLEVCIHACMHIGRLRTIGRGHGWTGPRLSMTRTLSAKTGKEGVSGNELLEERAQLEQHLLLFSEEYTEKDVMQQNHLH